MKSISEIRKDARQALKGKWLFTIFVQTVPALICSFWLMGIIYLLHRISDIDSNMPEFISNFVYSNIIPEIVYILTFYITLALNVWLINYFYSVYYYKEGKTELLDGFSPKYFKVFLLYFACNPIAALFIITNLIYIIYPHAILLMVVYILEILSTIVGIVLSFFYSMSFYVLIEKPEMSVIDCMRQSRKIMKGNKLRYLCLNLSFIGWILLSTVTLGIGFFYTVPYISTAKVAFYNEIK